MEIRRAKKEDAHIIAELESKCFINPWTETQFSYELNENEFSKTLLMFDGEKFVGYVNYWILFDHGEINKICVSEEYRRQGLATKLLDLAFKDFQDNECLSVSLEVRVSNEKAISLYEKFGFSRVVTKKGYYSDGEDAYYMIKGAY